MSDDLLRPDDLMRHLHKGVPLDLDTERVRLPRFTEIREVDPVEFGHKGKDPIVVARCRTATWALLPLTRLTSFEMKDAKQFLSLMESVQKKHPEKPVKGYVLTRGPIATASRAHLAASGHVVSAVSAVGAGA